MPAYNKLLWDRYRLGGEDTVIETHCHVGRKIPLIQDVIANMSKSSTKKKVAPAVDTPLRFYNLEPKTPSTHRRKCLTEAELLEIEKQWELMQAEGLWP